MIECYHESFLTLLLLPLLEAVLVELIVFFTGVVGLDPLVVVCLGEFFDE